MVDKIIELDNDNKYVILDEKELNNVKYYFGLRLDEKEEPTNNYLFFSESVNENNIYLTPIEDDTIKGLLVTAFTVNFLDKIYDQV